MSIPFYDFTGIHPTSFKAKALARMAQILEENSYVEGPYNQKFETEFAHMQGAKHALLVANGTDALEISLRAFDVGVGDKVGLPGITFYATAEAILNVGAIPVHIDVDEKTGLMDPDSLERVSKDHQLKAIIPVHIYGLPAPMDAIEKITKPLNIKIIEDAAQAQGTYLPKGPAGSGDNLVTFSFYPTKNLAAFGDAGAILTSSDELAHKIKYLRNHGRGSDKLGRNSRCDHLQAAVLHLKLEDIEKQNALRKKVAFKYHQQLKDVELMPKEFLETSSWHLYPIVLASIAEREKLQAYLKEQGIPSAPFYERAMSQEPELTKYEGETKVAEGLAGRVICLPLFPYLKDEQVDFVCKAINERTSL